jgi:hypothetical protein
MRVVSAQQSYASACSCLSNYSTNREVTPAVPAHTKPRTHKKILWTFGAIPQITLSKHLPQESLNPTGG